MFWRPSRFYRTALRGDHRRQKLTYNHALYRLAIGGQCALLLQDAASPSSLNPSSLQ